MTLDYAVELYNFATANPLFTGIALAVLAVLFHRSKRTNPHLTFGWGWCYILTDCDNPRIHKIGMTKRRPETRMEEVCWTMAGGAKLKLVYARYVPFVATVEMLAHQRMRSRQYRSERGTEWFVCSDKQARKAVDRAYRDVRSNAKWKRLWSADADRRVRSFPH